MNDSSERDPRHDAEAARLDGVIAGDAACFDAWFRGEHPAVWRLAFGLLGDRAEADDLAQDAMLHLHDKLSARDPRRSYRAWRDAVVWNLCRDRMRRRASRRRAEASGGAERAARVAPPAGDASERREVHERVSRALECLPDRERAAFVLRELEGHATAHVAAVLEIGESSVRSLLTLARRRLRAALGDDLDPRPAAARGEGDAS